MLRKVRQTSVGEANLQNTDKFTLFYLDLFNFNERTSEIHSLIKHKAKRCQMLQQTEETNYYN